MAAVICLSVSIIYIFATSEDKPVSAPQQPVTDDKLRRSDRLLKETIALLSADLYGTIYNLNQDTAATVSEVIYYAEKFERRLDWKKDDERDYIEELEKYEQEIIDSMNG